MSSDKIPGNTTKSNSVWDRHFILAQLCRDPERSDTNWWCLNKWKTMWRYSNTWETSKGDSYRGNKTQKRTTADKVTLYHDKVIIPCCWLKYPHVMLTFDHEKSHWQQEPLYYYYYISIYIILTIIWGIILYIQTHNSGKETFGKHGLGLGRKRKKRPCFSFFCLVSLHCACPFLLFGLIFFLNFSLLVYISVCYVSPLTNENVSTFLMFRGNLLLMSRTILPPCGQEHTFTLEFYINIL